MDHSGQKSADGKGEIRMKELVQLSGLSKATIHNYLNMGLLHEPNRAGSSRTRYDWAHLKRLKRIREMRDELHLPFSKIKEILLREEIDSAAPPEEAEDLLLKQAVEEEKKARGRKAELKRREILDAAIELFSKKGFENTTVEAISDMLDIGKSTVYLYFESKEDLLMECLGRLTYIALPKEDWDDIASEKDYVRRHRKRLAAFLKAFPRYSGILSMTRAAMSGENSRLAKKAEETLLLMTKPIMNDLRLGIEQGVLLDCDLKLVSHLLLAAGESLGFFLMMYPDYTPEEVIEKYIEFESQGLFKRLSGGAGAPEQAALRAVVTDLKGIETAVRGVRFGDKGFLPARIGEAQVEIDPAKVVEMRFLPGHPPLYAEVTTRAGDSVKIDVATSVTLSAEANFARYSIPLIKVSTIRFGDAGF